MTWELLQILVQKKKSRIISVAAMTCIIHTYTLPFHWNGVKLAVNLNFIKLVRIHRSEI